MKVLYTTGDAIFLAENGKTSELPSYRAMQYRQTVQQLHDNKAWKTTGKGAMFMGVAAEEETDVKVSFGGVARYHDEFLYSVILDASGGLYRRDFSEKPNPEGHVCSGNDMRFGAIAVHGEDVAACVQYPDGRSHIGLLHLPQSYCTEITDGDSVESAPSWSKDGRLLYFSTCGIGRGAQRLRFSPQSIAEYNVNTQQMKILLEDPKTDYISPKHDNDGNLWYIRQPYDPGEESNGNILLDTLLFPVRMIKALGGFLNMFSMRYGGESLRSGGNVKSKHKSEKDLFIEGNLIHAEKNLRENTHAGEQYPGILPKTRVLVRRTDDGKEEVMAKGVLDYCLCQDGFVYSNGSHILHRRQDGRTEQVAKAHIALRLTAIEQEDTV